MRISVGVSLSERMHAQLYSPLLCFFAPTVFRPTVMQTYRALPFLENKPPKEYTGSDR
jgi:hypothetical protein